MSEQTIEEVLQFPILEILDRGLNKKTVEHFQVRTELSKQDGVSPVAHYFPYTEDKRNEKGTVEKVVVGFKKRDLTVHKSHDYHFSHIGAMKAQVVDLFGTNCAKKTGNKKVFVTEGEYDAMACWQTLRNGYLKMPNANPRVNPTVVSIGFGAPNAVQHMGQKHVSKYLDKHDDCILAFDNDMATPKEKLGGVMRGKEAVEAVYGLLPNIKVAMFPEGQDPCDALTRVGEEQFYWMLMKPINFCPEGFTTYDEIREEAIALPTIGRSWPWKSVTKFTLGIRPGEGIYIGAGTKMGKSVVADMLIQHIVKNEVNINGDPQKVAVFKFEEAPAQTTRLVAGRFYKKNLSDPERMIFISDEGKEVDVWGDEILDNTDYYTHAELIEAVDDIGPRLVTYNNFGRCDWDQLKGAIRHAVLVEHITTIFIDPVTRLTAGMTPSEANTELERFADEISKMSLELGFTYFAFCHLKAPPLPLKPHENGGKVYSNQFRGSRAMQQACHYFIGLEGDKSVELPEKQRNTRYLVCLEDRNNGRNWRVPLFYDTKTSRLIEPPPGFLEDEEHQTLDSWEKRDMENVTNPELAEEAF